MYEIGDVRLVCIVFICWDHSSDGLELRKSFLHPFSVTCRMCEDINIFLCKSVVLEGKICVCESAYSRETHSCNRLYALLIRLLDHSVMHSVALIEERIEIEIERVDPVCEDEIVLTVKTVSERPFSKISCLRQGKQCICALERISCGILRSHDFKNFVPFMVFAKVFKAGILFMNLLALIVSYKEIER